MDSSDLKQRTKDYSLRIISLVNTLPNTPAGRVIGNQLLRSATSVGANYRSALRAKSKNDFLFKLNIAIEEADESLYRMELLTDSGLIPPLNLDELLNEGNQLVSIFIATARTTRENLMKK